MRVTHHRGAARRRSAPFPATTGSGGLRSRKSSVLGGQLWSADVVAATAPPTPAPEAAITTIITNMAAKVEGGVAPPSAVAAPCTGAAAPPDQAAAAAVAAVKPQPRPRVSSSGSAALATPILSDPSHTRRQVRKGHASSTSAPADTAGAAPDVSKAVVAATARGVSPLPAVDTLPLVYSAEFSAHMLTSAIRAHDIPTAVRVIKAGVVADSVLDRSLFRVARRGFASLVQPLVTAGAQVNQQLPNGVTPFAKAVACGHVATVRQLLHCGAGESVNLRDASGTTPLLRACRKGHAHVLPLLLAHGADPHARTDAGITVLMAAVQAAEADSDRGDLVRLLLSRIGSPPSRPRCPRATQPGAAPLLRVARHRASARSLRRLRRDILEGVEAGGLTALALACRSGQWRAADMLLAAGASPNTAQAGHDTPLVAAAGRADGGSMLERLLAAGADALAYGANRQTALIRAARRGNVDCIRVLARRCPDALELRDARGASALVWAALRGQRPAVESLLRHGAAVDGTTSGAATALMAACHRRQLGVVKMLLRSGADVLAETEGRQAISYAVLRGCTRIVAHLLGAGCVAFAGHTAPSAAGNGEGCRPVAMGAMLALAMRLGKVAVVRTLLSHTPQGEDLAQALSKQVETGAVDAAIADADADRNQRRQKRKCRAMVATALHASHQWRRRRTMLLLRELRDSQRVAPVGRPRRSALARRVGTASK